MDQGSADYILIAAQRQLEAALPNQEDTLNDLGVRRCARIAQQAQDATNAAEMPLALNNDLSDPSRGAQTRMALAALIRSMEEGDGKIADLEHDNGELQRELQIARANLAEMRTAFHDAHADVGVLKQELATARAELASADESREKIEAVVDVLSQTGLSQAMQIGCIKDIVASDQPSQPSPASEPVRQKFWLLLVAVYDDTAKLSFLDALAQLGFAFDKTSDYVVKVFGWVLLILLLSAVYQWLLPLPACPPGYVRVRY